jgi:uncharacterized protein (TIGR03067 family)
MTGKGIGIAMMVLACASAAWGEDGIEGVWVPTMAEIGGRPFPEEVRKTIRLVVEGDKYTVTVGAETDRGTCKLNPTAKPMALDITGLEGPNQGKTMLAIYEREGDVLRVCYDLSGTSRPSEFRTEEGKPLFLVTYQREKQ